MSPFADALRSAVPRPCFGRPVVCDGPPERCSVVVIGENPATQLGVDWWCYWNDSTGFRYEEWRSVYEQLRIQQGRTPVSNTRRRLDRLRDNGLSCLETNVFFNEGELGGDRAVANVDLLDLAFRTLPNLTFVIAHGKEAHEYLASRTVPSGIRGTFKTRHFRSESYETIDRISREIGCLTSACS